MNAAREPSGFTVWLTGLPCSGKSTLARLVTGALTSQGHQTALLDADDLRPRLFPELGYSRQDRNANVERIGFLAGLLNQHGVVAVVAAVSPFADARTRVKDTLSQFLEVYLECPLDTCERRDVKGLYAAARAGKLPNLTGIGDPYEAPAAPDLVLRTDRWPASACLAQLIRVISSRGWCQPLAGCEQRP